MTTRVLLLTQFFNPEPAIKGLVFARELVQQGFEVEVLTGFPNYPGGKIYPGYKIKWIQKEVIDGVNITRVPLYPSHDQSSVRRILNYVSFAASSLAYGLFGAKRPDIIYVFHPPLTVGVTAAIIRLFRKTPVVYDIQDMWPDSLLATGMINSKRLLKIVAIVCSWVYRKADHIVVLSPGFKRLLIERNVPADKVTVIYNWCDESSLNNPTGELSERFPQKERFRILFAGNMGKAQALDAVLQAAELLKEDYPEICFVFIGGGVESERLKKIAIDNSMSNAVFLPRVTMDKIGRLLQEADALIVHLSKDPLFEITIPSKTQAYMAIGKPILMAVGGDARELVIDADCGVVAESENPEEIAAAAQLLYSLPRTRRDELASNGRKFYNRNLSMCVGAAKFGNIFKKLATAENSRG